MRKLIVASVLCALMPAAVLADQDADNAVKARNDLYCGQLTKVITAQRNGADDAVASAAAQLTLLNAENATLRDKITMLQKQIDDAKKPDAESPKN